MITYLENPVRDSAHSKKEKKKKTTEVQRMWIKKQKPGIKPKKTLIILAIRWQRKSVD